MAAPTAVGLVDQGTAGYVCVLRGEDLTVSVANRMRCHMRVPMSSTPIDTMNEIVAHVLHNNGNMVPDGVDASIYAAAALVANGSFSSKICDGVLDVEEERIALVGGQRRTDTPTTPPHTGPTRSRLPPPQTPLYLRARGVRDEGENDRIFTKYMGKSPYADAEVDATLSEGDAMFVISDDEDAL